MNIYRGFLSIVLGLSLSGCLVTQPKFSEEEQKIASPINNITYYSEAFKKLNKLIINSKKPVYRFQVKSIDNLTSSKDVLPVDSKSFILTPLILHMRQMKVMAYEPYFSRYEAQTTGHIYFPSMKKIMPQLVIAGGITQFDKGIMSESDNLDIDAEYRKGADLSNLRASRDNSNSLSQLALDLNVFQYSNRIYLPGVATKNKIEIRRMRKKNRLGFFLNGSGLGESKYSTLQQSKDEALRILTEYSLLQLLGRLYQVPYWTCTTPNMPVDPLVLYQELGKSAEFTNAKLENKQRLIENIISLYGYNNVIKDGKLAKDEQEMLLQIAKKYKFTNTKVFSTEFYELLQKNIPKKDKS